MKHETKYIKRPVFGMETGEEILIYNIYVKISNSSFTHTDESSTCLSGVVRGRASI